MMMTMAMVRRAMKSTMTATARRAMAQRDSMTAMTMAVARRDTKSTIMAKARQATMTMTTTMAMMAMAQRDTTIKSRRAHLLLCAA
jgi:hypothetical protein